MNYTPILNSFNLLNPHLEKGNGLVYAFDDAPERPLESIEAVKKFFSVLIRRSFVVKAGVNEDLFDRDDYFLLQLDGYDEEIYTLPLDISYFVWLSDYLDADGRLISYRFSDANKILQNLLVRWNQGNHFLGWMLPSTASYAIGEPSNIMQYHLPWIRKSNIADVARIRDIC